MSDEYTVQQGKQQILEALVGHSAYPQGNPSDVTVTLSDEHWNAVCFALQAALIGHMTTGARMMPDFLAEQMHDAYHKIEEAAVKVLGVAAVDELIDELRKGMES